jgi:hypothetical protein
VFCDAAISPITKREISGASKPVRNWHIRNCAKTDRAYGAEVAKTLAL